MCTLIKAKFLQMTSIFARICSCGTIKFIILSFYYNRSLPTKPTKSLPDNFITISPVVLQTTGNMHTHIDYLFHAKKYYDNKYLSSLLISIRKQILLNATRGLKVEITSLRRETRLYYLYTRRSRETMIFVSY